MNIVIQKTVRIHTGDEWIQTDKGERQVIMTIKGIALCVSWDKMKILELNQRIAKFPKMTTKIQDELERQGVKSETDEIIADFLSNVYKNPENFRMLKFIDAYATDKMKREEPQGQLLRYIEEKEVYDALNAYIKNTNISSTDYVSSMVYKAHAAFYHIGREYSWCDREDIKVATNFNFPLLNGGNPVTKSTKNAIKDKFAKLKPGRQSKFQIEDKNGEKIELNKHGKPGSIAVVFHVMSTIFANILKSIRPDNGLNDMPPVENWVNVLMLYYFLIHEGARPGDTTGGKIADDTDTDERGQQHESMTFSFNGETFYILVLAFVKPSTLAYFLDEGQLKRYVCMFYKGKVGEYRGRVKSWMPPAYNMLDLATMYVILMRIKLVIAPQNVGSHVFKKGQKISKHFKQNTKPLPNKRKDKQEFFSVNVEGLTAYSIRYASAEEEKKFMINEEWTRYRMGHSKISDMSKVYGDNKGQRLSFIGDNFKVQLGSDLNKPLDVMNPRSIPLLSVPYYEHNEMPSNPVTCNNTVKKEIVNELKTLSELIDPLVKGKSTLQDLLALPEIDGVPHLKHYIPNDRPALWKELNSIPLGMHCKFSDGLLSDKTKNELDERLQYIGSCFKAVQVPETPQSVWAYPQVMWGEWNQELKAEVVEGIRNQLRHNLSLATEGLRGVEPTPSTKRPKKRSITTDEPTPSTKRPKKADDIPSGSQSRISVLKTSIKDRRVIIDYKPEIWIGRMVAIVCSNPGSEPSYEYLLQGTKHYVWFGIVKSFNRVSQKTYTFKARVLWYTGHIGEMVPGYESDTEPIPPEGLVYSWEVTKEQEARFGVPKEDFAKMVKHLNQYWESK